MTVITLAASDVFTIGNNLISKLGHLAGAGLILVIGLMAARHVGREHPIGAIAVVLLALIPAWFIFDPHGAASSFTSAVHSLGG